MTATNRGWIFSYKRVIAAVRRGPIEVKTSMQASSTGYPFKVTSVEGTISQESVYEGRERIATWVTCATPTSRRAVPSDTGAPVNQKPHSCERVVPSKTPRASLVFVTG